MLLVNNSHFSLVTWQDIQNLKLPYFKFMIQHCVRVSFMTHYELSSEAECTCMHIHEKDMHEPTSSMITKDMVYSWLWSNRPLPSHIIYSITQCNLARSVQLSWCRTWQVTGWGMTLEIAWRTRPLQLVLSGGPVTSTPTREYNGLRGENRVPYKGQQASASNPVMFLFSDKPYVLRKQGGL